MHCVSRGMRGEGVGLYAEECVNKEQSVRNENTNSLDYIPMISLQFINVLILTFNSKKRHVTATQIKCYVDKTIGTRMHSSRMRTPHSLPYRGVSVRERPPWTDTPPDSPGHRSPNRDLPCGQNS